MPKERILFLFCLLTLCAAGTCAWADVVWVQGEESCLAGLCHTDHLEGSPLILFSDSAPAAPDILRSVSAVVLCRPLEAESRLPDALRDSQVRVSYVTEEPKGIIALPDMPSAGAGHAYRLHIVLSDIAGVSENKKGRTGGTAIGWIEIGGEVFPLELLTLTRSADLVILTTVITLQNNTFSYRLVDAELPLKRIVLEQIATEKHAQVSGSPTLFVRRFSPSKYFVRIRRARDPFWLVLGERFHQHWRLYAVPKQADALFRPVSETFRAFNVQEAAATALFDIRELSYLLKRPLAARHIKVNGFANGWLIDPAQEGLPEDHDLIIFYWPQAFFYLGLLLTGLVFVSTGIFILLGRRNKP